MLAPLLADHWDDLSADMLVLLKVDLSAHQLAPLLAAHWDDLSADALVHQWVHLKVGLSVAGWVHL
jgi:hypothetical protein